MFMKIIVIGIQGTGVDLFAGCLQVIQRIFQNLQEGKIQIFISLAIADFCLCRFRPFGNDALEKNIILSSVLI